MQSVRLAVQGLILSIMDTLLSVGVVVGTLCAQQFTVTTDAGAVIALQRYAIHFFAGNIRALPLVL